MKLDIKECILTVSVEGLGHDAAARMQAGGVGSTLYPNEYGGILFVGNPDRPDFSDKGPARIQHLAQWAWRYSVTWLMFDLDGYSLTHLKAAMKKFISKSRTALCVPSITACGNVTL